MNQVDVDKLDTGVIALANVLDPNGRNPKLRPVINLTSTADVCSGQPLVCVLYHNDFATASS